MVCSPTRVSAGMGLRRATSTRRCAGASEHAIRNFRGPVGAYPNSLLGGGKRRPRYRSDVVHISRLARSGGDWLERMPGAQPVSSGSIRRQLLLWTIMNSVEAPGIESWPVHLIPLNGAHG